MSFNYIYIIYKITFLSGDLDAGEALKKLLMLLEPFFGNDIYAALLVLGGVAMAFHYQLLHDYVGGVPPTIAIGDPVSGKSTAIEAAMAIFGHRESTGCKFKIVNFECSLNSNVCKLQGIN